MLYQEPCGKSEDFFGEHPFSEKYLPFSKIAGHFRLKNTLYPGSHLALITPAT